MDQAARQFLVEQIVSADVDIYTASSAQFQLYDAVTNTPGTIEDLSWIAALPVTSVGLELLRTLMKHDRKRLAVDPQHPRSLLSACYSTLASKAGELLVSCFAHGDRTEWSQSARGLLALREGLKCEAILQGDNAIFGPIVDNSLKQLLISAFPSTESAAPPANYWLGHVLHLWQARCERAPDAVAVGYLLAFNDSISMWHRLRSIFIPHEVPAQAQAHDRIETREAKAVQVRFLLLLSLLISKASKCQSAEPRLEALQQRCAAYLSASTELNVRKVIKTAVQLLLDNDHALIRVLLHWLDLFKLSNSDYTNPHLVFAMVMQNIAYDHHVLLDWLISSETRFLEYLVRYLRLVSDAKECWGDRRSTKIRECLCQLTTTLERLSSRNLFPYNCKPLIKRLRAVLE